MTKFTVGMPVRLRFSRSVKLPKGSFGVVTRVYSTDPEQWIEPMLMVEWRRGVEEQVSARFVKPASEHTISRQQRVWMVKRRLKEAI